MSEASRRAALKILSYIDKHADVLDYPDGIARIVDTAIARAVEGERERIIAFMGDGLSEWHRAALRAPGVKTNEKEVVERIVTGGQPG